MASQPTNVIYDPSDGSYTITGIGRTLTVHPGIIDNVSRALLSIRRQDDPVAARTLARYATKNTGIKVHYAVKGDEPVWWEFVQDPNDNSAWIPCEDIAYVARQLPPPSVIDNFSSWLERVERRRL